MKTLYEAGQQIETKIVAISNDTIFLDLGLKSEGILDKAELADENGNVSVKEGDSIKVFFLKEINDELHFTTKLSGKDTNKDLLENAYKSGIPVEGKVTQEIKGGYEVMLGSSRAFCPYSQMGYKQRKDASEYIGCVLTFKIQEYKNDGRNIILSNRAVLEQEENEKINRLAQELKVGMTVKGTVLSIESYGAFVNVNGFKALLPIGEISRARIDDVSKVLSVGQEITAQIIKADWEHERLSLSTKIFEEDPFNTIETKFPIGSEFEGTISRVADFGLFINMASGVDGLVHISKLPVERNTNLRKVYKVGESLKVAVESIDMDNRRIALTPVISNEEQENADEYIASHKDDDDGETYNPFATLLKKN